MKISYGITVHNESEELNKLLEILVHKTDPDDEIVIVQDGDDKKVEEVISSWSQQYLCQPKFPADWARRRTPMTGVGIGSSGIVVLATKDLADLLPILTCPLLIPSQLCPTFGRIEAPM